MYFGNFSSYNDSAVRDLPFLFSLPIKYPEISILSTAKTLA